MNKNLTVIDNNDNECVMYPLCWRCGDNNKVYKNFKNGTYKCGITHSICSECYNNNIDNKLVNCISCNNPFLVDFTQLKDGQIINYGFSEFIFCFECMSTNQYKKNAMGIHYQILLITP